MSDTMPETMIEHFAPMALRQTFGFTSPVLIDEKDRILAGYGRVDAAKLLRMETVPRIGKLRALSGPGSGTAGRQCRKRRDHCHRKKARRTAGR